MVIEILPFLPSDVGFNVVFSVTLLDIAIYYT